MPVHFVNKWAVIYIFKRGKYRKGEKPTNINFLSIFAIFDSTKSVEDSWLLCIYVIYDTYSVLRFCIEYKAVLPYKLLTSSCATTIQTLQINSYFKNLENFVSNSVGLICSYIMFTWYLFKLIHRSKSDPNFN